MDCDRRRVRSNNLFFLLRLNKIILSTSIVPLRTNIFWNTKNYSFVELEPWCSRITPKFFLNRLWKKYRAVQKIPTSRLIESETIASQKNLDEVFGFSGALSDRRLQVSSDRMIHSRSRFANRIRSNNFRPRRLSGFFKATLQCDVRRSALERYALA